MSRHERKAEKTWQQLAIIELQQKLIDSFKETKNPVLVSSIHLLEKEFSDNDAFFAETQQILARHELSASGYAPTALGLFIISVGLFLLWGFNLTRRDPLWMDSNSLKILNCGAAFGAAISGIISGYYVYHTVYYHWEVSKISGILNPSKNPLIKTVNTLSRSGNEEKNKISNKPGTKAPPDSVMSKITYGQQRRQQQNKSRKGWLAAVQGIFTRGGSMKTEQSCLQSDAPATPHIDNNNPEKNNARLQNPQQRKKNQSGGRKKNNQPNKKKSEKLVTLEKPAVPPFLSTTIPPKTKNFEPTALDSATGYQITAENKHHQKKPDKWVTLGKPATPEMLEDGVMRPETKNFEPASLNSVMGSQVTGMEDQQRELKIQAEQLFAEKNRLEKELEKVTEQKIRQDQVTAALQKEKAYLAGLILKEQQSGTEAAEGYIELEKKWEENNQQLLSVVKHLSNEIAILREKLSQSRQAPGIPVVWVPSYVYEQNTLPHIFSLPSSFPPSLPLGIASGEHVLPPPLPLEQQNPYRGSQNPMTLVPKPRHRNSKNKVKNLQHSQQAYYGR